MGFLNRLFHQNAPDIGALRALNDVPGLVQALQHESPAVVGTAARRIASLHEFGEQATRAQAAAAGSALLQAFQRERAKVMRLGHDHPRGEDDRRAVWAVVDALGEIRAPEAEPVLVALLDRSSPDEYVQYDARVREHAARALGRVPGDGHLEVLQGYLDPHYGEALAVSAAVGLLALGTDGPQLLRQCLLNKNLGLLEWTLLEALRSELQARGTEYDAARGILNDVLVSYRRLEELRTKQRMEESRREAEQREAEERWQAEQREAWERAALKQRLTAFPLAAKLAGLLSHPEWVAGSHLLKPSTDADYVEAVTSCRAFGLPVEEHTKVLEVRLGRGTHGYDEPDETEIRTFEVSATVEFEGEPFLIEGGQREQRVPM